MNKTERKQFDAVEELSSEFFKQCTALKAAIRKTIKENQHLADGEACTLIHLKKALEKVKKQDAKRHERNLELEKVAPKKSDAVRGRGRPKKVVTA